MTAGLQPPPAIIAAARAADAKWRVPASVTLAQWALESGWGRHMPPGSNNPFGIKARPGEVARAAATREVVGGDWERLEARFRAFATLDEAFDEHARLLATARVYAPARACLPDVKAFCAALTGRYATDPEYGIRLAAVIDGSHLERFDR
jgi:flagellum-specific peptidoglycan hydrolase FlgJ